MWRWWEGRAAVFSLILRALECVPVQNNSFPVCLFPEHLSRSCRNNMDKLCYMWRADNESTKAADITTCEESLRSLFQDKIWAPNICCSTFSRTLKGWLKARTCRYTLLFPCCGMHFAITCTTAVFASLTWLASPCHQNKKYNITVYILHWDPSRWRLNANAVATRRIYSGLRTRIGRGFTRIWDKYEGKPRFFSAQYHTATLDHSHWVERRTRKFYLQKTKAQLLGSRLQQRNLLEKGVKLSLYRKRQANITSYFSMYGNLLYCNDVCGLMEELQVRQVSDQWRLYIAYSKFSLKAVLLHNGNKFPTVAFVHAVHMQETYASIQRFLEKICYEDHQWNTCADLKVVALLTGLQGGCTKLCCVLFERDSRGRDRHYHVKQWPLRG